MFLVPLPLLKIPFDTTFFKSGSGVKTCEKAVTLLVHIILTHHHHVMVRQVMTMVHEP